MPSYVRGVIIGLLLSDGYLRFSSSRSKNARLRIEQSQNNSGYLWFVFYILIHYCSCYPVYRKRTRLGKINYSLELATRTLPCLTELYYQFYVKGVKVIPPPARSATGGGPPSALRAGVGYL